MKILDVFRVFSCIFLPAALAAAAFGQIDIRQPAAIDEGKILGVRSIDGRTGFVYSEAALFRTDSGGRSWAALSLPVGLQLKIAGVTFNDASNGWAVLAGPELVIIAATSDGGATWTTHHADIDLTAGEIDTSSALIENSGGIMSLRFRLETSSNFDGKITFHSTDGEDWDTGTRVVEPRTDREPDDVSSNGWIVRTEGKCVSGKETCFQTTRLINAVGDDITPQPIRAKADEARQRAEQKASPSLMPPGGTMRISLNRGFDQCNAPTSTAMRTWWNNSPLYDSNIYISGRNRGCSAQPNLSATWVDQVTAMGWGLIPTVVGYQSPCTASTTTAKLSYDVATAETQGRGEADIAVSDASNLGLTAGSILYYDMERYDPPSPDTLGCRAATVSFLKGWTERIHELGYRSGTYGSPKNAQEDWAGLAPSSKMDAIWMARWDNIPSVWNYLSFPTFPTTEWAAHQRIKQWQAPHNETWGGVTFNIDGNNSDGPVAGTAILKNRNADFDGDGRSDLSVYRPDTGTWYVYLSSTSTLSGTGFGNATDIIAPGDYDGDGKTDNAIFRPADGIWHMLTKGGIYSTRQFGSTGDVPVPADYNGDGKTDIAVWRPSNGVWYIANSDSQETYTFIQFGQAGDKPVPGDYDGDGKTDIAVWRPSNGVWYIYRSSDQQMNAIGFGLLSDLPAQGDYDGDGKADQAVYRNGYWYLNQSSAGFRAISFGLPGDLPATGDFDGDGKADVTVFRPSNGVWYIMQSQNGFAAYQFGVTNDQPVTAAYLPR